MTVTRFAIGAVGIAVLLALTTTASSFGKSARTEETSIEIFAGSVGCRARIKGLTPGPQLGIVVWLTDPAGTTLRIEEQYTYGINLVVEFAVEPPVTGSYTCYGTFSVEGTVIANLQQSANFSAFCPEPTNFRIKEVTYPNFPSIGTLLFEYEWDSSNGNVQQLNLCEVRERVGFNPAHIPHPSPPFAMDDYPAGGNPTVTDPPIPGTDGGLFDELVTKLPFVQPYSAVAVFASQRFEYRCSCGGGLVSGWVTIHEPFPNIKREFIQNPGGSWRFETSKSGYTATMNPLPQ